MKTKLIAVLVTIVIALANSQASAQGMTIGFNGQLSVGGSFNTNLPMVMNINARTMFFPSPMKKGFFILTHSQGQIITGDKTPFSASFSLGAGSRFVFPNADGFPANLEFGMGMGVQSVPKPYVDELNREVYQSPMRGMGYISGQLPIKWSGHNHALMFQTNLSMSFDPWAKKNTVAEVSYWWQANVALQVTHFKSGIDLYVGAYSERYLATGGTAGLVFADYHCQLGVASGVNPENKQGGVQCKFQFNF